MDKHCCSSDQAGRYNQGRAQYLAQCQTEGQSWLVGQGQNVEEFATICQLLGTKAELQQTHLTHNFRKLLGPLCV